MQLYNIRFTTKHVVTKYDHRGKAIGSYETAIDQSMTALPHSTAMAYANCDNFKIEPHIAEPERGPRQSFKLRTGGDVTAVWTKRPKTMTTTPTKKSARASGVREAAASGDLSAALNGGK